MRKAAALLLLLVAFAPVAAAQPASELNADVLMIDAGRLDAMVDQSEEALLLIAPQTGSGDLAEDFRIDAHAFRALASAVNRYNLVLGQACRGRAVSKALCTGPFSPAWLKQPSAAAHSPAQLRAMIDEATARFTPLWTELCNKGKRLAHDESFCRLE